MPRRGTEGSFRLAAGALVAERELIGIEKRHFTVARFMRLARELGMPEAYLGIMEEEHAQATFFYFGYEESVSGDVLKLYIEYPYDTSPLSPAEADGPDASRRTLAGLGYKWDATRGNPIALTHYFWYVHLAPARILERMRELQGGAAAPAFEVVREAVAATSQSVEVVYVEAMEPGNRRKSFDVNVYAAHRPVSSIAPGLTRLAATYGVDPAPFAALLERVGDKQLAHFSGGIHRDGGDYLTTYYVI